MDSVCQSHGKLNLARYAFAKSSYLHLQVGVCISTVFRKRVSFHVPDEYGTETRLAEASPGVILILDQSLEATSYNDRAFLEW